LDIRNNPIKTIELNIAKLFEISNLKMDFSKVEALHLDNMDFSLGFPKAISQFKSLNTLTMENSKIKSDENFGVISHLSKLKYLSLHGMQLGNLEENSMKSLSSLGQLRYLNISSCSLKKVPNFLIGDKCIKLQELDLRSNDIENIPNTFLQGAKDRMEYLYLAENPIGDESLQNIMSSTWNKLKLLDISDISASNFQASYFDQLPALEHFKVLYID
jgi:Leucine-rich repeat (LRR) protein